MRTADLQCVTAKRKDRRKAKEQTKKETRKQLFFSALPTRLTCLATQALELFKCLVGLAIPITHHNKKPVESLVPFIGGNPQFFQLTSPSFTS